MLSMIFTFVFCFNLEKTPQNIEFRPKITCYTIQRKTKIPVTLQWVMLPGFLRSLRLSQWQLMPTGK